jgi:hypothetical protein
MKNSRRAACASAAGTLAMVLLSTTVFASSHREAPRITEMPKLDGTDFYMFNSYEPGRTGYVTLVANYIPLEDPYGGPNYFTLDHHGYYDIDIDNTGSGRPDIIFRFKFSEHNRNIALNIGGKSVAIPLVDAGPIGVNGNPADNANQNVFETFTLTMIRGPGSAQQVTDAESGGAVFAKPIDNIGIKTLPNYAQYAQNFVRPINIPGCGPGRLFVGQRKDPFVVNLGQTFDLVNYAHPIGEQYAKAGHDDLADKNVTSLELEVPASCLTPNGDPVVGGWTTSSMAHPRDNHDGNFDFDHGDVDHRDADRGDVDYEQVSRLGNPLVNELVIGLKDKDKFNSSVPANDAQFATYVTNPTVPAIIASIFSSAGIVAPKVPRNDLVAVFLTGLKGLNQPAHLQTPSEEMRLNTSIAPVAAQSQSRLGVIGGDNAGYPNGRRPGDDVVDITLRVAMGRLYTLGLFGSPSDAPSGSLDFTDGAYVDSTFFDDTFPYLKTPLGGSPNGQ